MPRRDLLWTNLRILIIGLSFIGFVLHNSSLSSAPFKHSYFVTLTVFQKVCFIANFVTKAVIYNILLAA